MKIGEVSKKYNINIETLRYYENEGLLGDIYKNKSGIREYLDDDLRKIEFIKCMREAKMPINTLKEFINLYNTKSNKERKKEIVNNQIKTIDEEISKLNEAKKILEEKLKLIEKNII